MQEIGKIHHLFTISYRQKKFKNQKQKENTAARGNWYTIEEN